MTAPPQVLAAPVAAMFADEASTGPPLALEALGTFCLLTAVGVALCVANPVVALGVGAVLVALIYAGSHRAGAHFNPAITLAALWWRRISPRDAAGYWSAQLAAGVCAVWCWHAIVGSGRIAAAALPALDGRTLIAALAAQLVFSFVLSHVVLSCVAIGRDRSNLVSDLAIGVGVVAGAVDVGAVLGSVYMVSQIVTGAIAGIAFLAFGAAGR